MLSCEETSRLVSESMDRYLPLNKRIAVRMHLLMCRACASFRKQLLWMRKAVHHLRDEISDDASVPSLAPNDLRRIRDSLQLALQESRTEKT